MVTEESSIPNPPESRLADSTSEESLLLQLRSDRRLGHEWDDWDGRPLPDDGVFEARETLFFQLATAVILASSGAIIGVLWLLAPRLAALWQPLEQSLRVAVLVTAGLGLLWLTAVAIVLGTGRNWLPERLAERGLIPWLMPRIEAVAKLVGVSRDRMGNAAVRVYNRLSAARSRSGIMPRELLILLPRCLGKEAMRSAMGISERYGVPIFVAARGRYARQMIAMRRPKAIVAVACERDLVSGIGDVARHLPVLGTTLQLADGPCRNTHFAPTELEEQVRLMLGLADRGRPPGGEEGA
ncbi:MAG: DUF116 domain-containing protein [Gemmatimonadota bacterium]